MSIREYILGWKDENTAFYIDAFDCKYAAKNGNLAWRINNPGLIEHHCRFAKRNGSIGTWGKFAIFSNPLQGHQALKEWLFSKKRYQSDLFALGKHYQPDAPEQFVQNLVSSIGVSSKVKLKNLTNKELEWLISFIEKLCGFFKIGNEELFLLPKIAAKIEVPGKTDLYLIGKDTTLTQAEAINWINLHRLDAVIVNPSIANTYIRSRPRYQMQILRLSWEQNSEVSGELDILARVVGEKTTKQCVGGFINGIRNLKEEALESSTLISNKAENEQVFALRNDQFLYGAKEMSVALLLKAGIDTPVVKNAAKFLRYLLSMSEGQEGGGGPVILFAHSQGAAIAEHAIELLSTDEKQKIRIFTFGGWSFIPPGVTHPESHNYASVGDLIPRMGSFNLQYFAIRKYEGFRGGLNPEEIVWKLAFRDAIHELSSTNPQIIETYTNERCKFYRSIFEKIKNVTVVDSINTWEHSFNNENYQRIVHEIIQKYRKNSIVIAEINSKYASLELFV